MRPIHRLLALCLVVVAGCGDDPTGPGTPRTYTYEFLPAGDGRSLRSVWRVGDVVYVTHGGLDGNFSDGGIAYYRVTSDASANGTSVEPLGTLALGGRVASLAGKGNILYAGGAGGSWVIDVSDPLDPQSLGSRGLVATSNGMRVSGDQLLLMQGTDLRIYDVSDPATPRQTHTSNSNCWAGDIRDERFVMGQFPEDRILLYDVSTDGVFANHANATMQFSGVIYHARLVGDFLYVIEEFHSESRAVLHVYSVPNLISGTGVREIQTIDFVGTRRGFDANESHVLTVGGPQIELFERGDDGRLTLVEEFAPTGLYIGSGFPFYAFLANGVLYAPGESRVFVATF